MIFMNNKDTLETEQPRIDQRLITNDHNQAKSLHELGPSVASISVNYYLASGAH